MTQPGGHEGGSGHRGPYVFVPRDIGVKILHHTLELDYHTKILCRLLRDPFIRSGVFTTIGNYFKVVDQCQGEHSSTNPAVCIWKEILSLNNQFNRIRPKIFCRRPRFTGTKYAYGNTKSKRESEPTASTSQVPTNRVPTSQVPTNRVPTSQVPTNQVPTSQIPTTSSTVTGSGQTPQSKDSSPLYSGDKRGQKPSPQTDQLSGYDIKRLSDIVDPPLHDSEKKTEDADIPPLIVPDLSSPKGSTLNVVRNPQFLSQIGPLKNLYVLVNKKELAKGQGSVGCDGVETEKRKLREIIEMHHQKNKIQKTGECSVSSSMKKKPEDPNKGSQIRIKIEKVDEEEGQMAMIIDEDSEVLKIKIKIEKNEEEINYDVTNIDPGEMLVNADGDIQVKIKVENIKTEEEEKMK